LRPTRRNKGGLVILRAEPQLLGVQTALLGTAAACRRLLPVSLVNRRCSAWKKQREVISKQLIRQQPAAASASGKCAPVLRARRPVLPTSQPGKGLPDDRATDLPASRRYISPAHRLCSSASLRTPRTRHGTARHSGRSRAAVPMPSLSETASKLTISAIQMSLVDRM
jgi:hypothetical protein